MTRVAVVPDLLTWACERSRIAPEYLHTKFPKLDDWLSGERQPTLKQLDTFARSVHVPIGYLFLEKPPEEQFPIPDFRTIGNQAVARPSPNLLDTIYVCQERQSWYRSYSLGSNLSSRSFVGSSSLETPIATAAAAIAGVLGFDLDARRVCPTWTDALREFIRLAEDAGILVMVTGVVLSNNNRKLDPDEFRGFALSDDRAPLVFINGADTKAAQTFTLAHELAHIWLGESAISDGTPLSTSSNRSERWCNEVAAELLVPLEVLTAELRPSEALPVTLQRLARRFKVSTLVIISRLRDASWLSPSEASIAYAEELERIRAITANREGGGNYYLSTSVRVSRRFASALIESTLGGQTLYRDAFRMLGMSKVATLHELGRNLGFAV